MGDAELVTSEGDRFHENFAIKIQKVKFEHVDSYQAWCEQSAIVTIVLQDFTTKVGIARRRNENEMASQEAKDALRLHLSPKVTIRAKFDTDINIKIKTEIFAKLCQIQTLFLSEPRAKQHQIDSMNDQLRKAHLASYMKRQNILLQWVCSTGCLVKPNSLVLFEKKELHQYRFALDGVDAPDGCLLEGSELTLKNAWG